MKFLHRLDCSKTRLDLGCFSHVRFKNAKDAKHRPLDIFQFLSSLSETLTGRVFVERLTGP